MTEELGAETGWKEQRSQDQGQQKKKRGGQEEVQGWGGEKAGRSSSGLMRARRVEAEVRKAAEGRDSWGWTQCLGCNEGELGGKGSGKRRDWGKKQGAGARRLKVVEASQEAVGVGRLENPGNRGVRERAEKKW